MTFRDKSADVTLNNANEEIMRTKYARSDPRNPDPKGDFARRERLEAEIDALKMELIEVRSELVKSGMERLSLMSENTTFREELSGFDSLNRIANKEIDALKAEKEAWEVSAHGLAQARDGYERNWRMAEGKIAALKAENERLRADAERLDWLEAHPRLGEIHVDGEVKDCYLYAVSGALGVPLRAIIDATMKDFSTTQEGDDGMR
jgi:chromosome segregation ATPase